MTRAVERTPRRTRLPSLLIKPIQRLPRYVMLLRELVSLTPQTHKDAEPLAAALAKMQAVASELNEAKRQAESFADVLRVFNSIAPRDRESIQDLIAPHRRFVREGAVHYRKDELSRNEPHVSDDGDQRMYYSRAMPAVHVSLQRFAAHYRAATRRRVPRRHSARLVARDVGARS